MEARKKKEEEEEDAIPLGDGGRTQILWTSLAQSTCLVGGSLMFSVGNLYLVSTINGEVIYQPNAASTFLKTEL